MVAPICAPGDHSRNVLVIQMKGQLAPPGAFWLRLARPAPGEQARRAPGEQKRQMPHPLAFVRSPGKQPGAPERLRVRLGAFRVRPWAYLRARIMRALAGLCVRLGVCLRVCASVRVRACGPMGARGSV